VLFVRGDHAPPPPPPPAPLTLTVGELEGEVEIAGPDGAFRPARPGDTLSSAARIRTGDGGAATLRAADGSTVKLLGATRARVETLTRELARLTLGSGMVEAEVRDDPTRLVELDLDDPEAVARGDGAAARTRGASFVAATDGQGRSSVASRNGEVILSARGKQVTIHTGQYARVAPGEPPGAPSPIPPSLFLKVVWPAASSRDKRVTVRGEVQPGARVRVEGRFVRVAPDGSYTAQVPLSDGTHRLRVEATDVAGRPKREQSPPITIDTSTDFKVKKPRWGQ
jgi:hypothetical protein